jgi:predicted nucleotidyltransferase
MREEILRKVKEAVLQLETSADVILYGSRARDDYREYSDWDFLILLDGQIDTKRIDRIRYALYEIELNTDQIISSIVRSREEWDSPRYSVVPLHRNIEREGISI